MEIAHGTPSVENAVSADMADVEDGFTRVGGRKGNTMAYSAGGSGRSSEKNHRVP